MKKTDKPDFSADLAELEAIANWFESQDIDLDEGLKKFERGIQLAEGLKKQLESLQNQVQKIAVRFDGQQADGDLKEDV